MAEKGSGARRKAGEKADPKEGDEKRTMQHRRLYLTGRIASLRDELSALQKERTEIDTKLKAKPEVADEKKLRQRRVYVSGRPESLRGELTAATTELKEILGKLGRKAA